jgi:hypothetical protein
MMDLAQLQGIEAALRYILSQGPDAINHLVAILTAIKNGAGAFGAIAGLLLQWSALGAIVDQLLALIGSGATIVEIAKAIADLAAAVGISSELVIQFLQLLGYFLLGVSL